MLRKTLLLFLALGSFYSTGQDTVSVMYYNLLNFPQINSGRINNLKTVLQHTLPDILVVCELTSASGSNAILANALNTNGITKYDKANYVNGPDTDRMLYYDSTRFGYIGENEIATSVRDINEYILYYKTPGLSAGQDTIFLYMYCAHLKAGTTSSDEQQRSTEAQILRNYLNTRPNPENTIVGGDLNIYGSYENAYDFLTKPTGADLIDPIGAATYHNNSAYAYIHTQCTRLTSIDGGSTGGMDDRFDYILHSQDIESGTNGVQYIPGSHKAIGQDGLRYNQNLISPTNNSEPSNVISALYYMSDHLPVVSLFAIDSDLDIKHPDEETFNMWLSDNVLHLSFDNPIEGTIDLYDLTGKRVAAQELNRDSNARINMTANKGMYIVVITTAQGTTCQKLVY